MQFESSVFADEFTPREVSARPSALFSELEPEAIGKKNQIENFGTVEKCILRVRHWNHLGFPAVFHRRAAGTGQNTAPGQLTQNLDL
jgi:hypothetical protein